MAATDSHCTPSEHRWWVEVDGRAEGPYGAAYITAALRGGQFPRTTLVCLNGTEDWLPVSDWSEFADVRCPPPLPRPLSDPPDSPHKHPLTNPRLPTMANWICIYCLMLSPVLWFCTGLSCVITLANLKPHDEWTAFAKLIHLAVDAGVTATLFVGARRLRDLRASGCRLVKMGLWINWGYFALCVALFILWAGISAAAGTLDDGQTTTSSSSTLDALLFLIGLPAICFEIVAIVWLHRRSKWLPYLTE